VLICLRLSEAAWWSQPWRRTVRGHQRERLSKRKSTLMSMKLCSQTSLVSFLGGALSMYSFELFRCTLSSSFELFRCTALDLFTPLCSSSCFQEGRHVRAHACTHAHSRRRMHIHFLWAEVPDLRARSPRRGAAGRTRHKLVRHRPRRLACHIPCAARARGTHAVPRYFCLGG